MRNGNPNLPTNAYAVRHFDQSPQQPGSTNPFGFGVQRTAGQLATQPATRTGMMNWSVGMPPAQRAGTPQGFHNPAAPNTQFPIYTGGTPLFDETTGQYVAPPQLGGFRLRGY